MFDCGTACKILAHFQAYGYKELSGLGRHRYHAWKREEDTEVFYQDRGKEDDRCQ